MLGFCENIKSYKKLIPTLAAGCDLPVVTIDDDYIYPTDLLERLIVASNLWPETVVSTFVHRMTFEPNGFPNPIASGSDTAMQACRKTTYFQWVRAGFYTLLGV